MSKLNARRQFAGERMLLGFLVCLNIAQYILVRQLELYVSDGPGSVGISNTEQLAILLTTVHCHFAFYWFYKAVVPSIPGPEERKSNILPALLCGMLLTLTGFLAFDYGKAEHSSSLPFGFILRLVRTDFLFGYFISTCDFRKWTPRIITTVFIALKISMGWTGVQAAGGLFKTLKASRLLQVVQLGPSRPGPPLLLAPRSKAHALNVSPSSPCVRLLAFFGPLRYERLIRYATRMANLRRQTFLLAKVR